MEFNAREYICKFCFTKYDHTGANSFRQRVCCNLYLKELTIEIINPSDKVTDVFGYRIDNKIKSLLPMLKWELFERMRDKSGWELPNVSGYRDGWGYEFYV